MISFIEYKNIDRVKWDLCIHESADGNIFNTSWYLDACCEHWDALIEDDYEAVFALPSRSRLGIKYIYQPFFTRHCGMISRYRSTPEKRMEFLNAIPQSFRYTDIFLHKNHHELPEGLEHQHRVYQQLSLNTTYESVRKNYSENHKRTLRKAEKAALILKGNFDPAELIRIFRMYKRDEDVGLKHDNFVTLLNLMKDVKSNSDCRCYAAYNSSDEIQAAAFFMNYKSTWIYLKGFSVPDGRNNGAMHFIFDSFIREISTSYEILDFGGSAVPGVAKFYRGFGAVDSLYLRFRQNHLPALIRWIKNLND